MKRKTMANRRKRPKAFTEKQKEKICVNCDASDKCEVYKLAVELSKQSSGDLTYTFGCTEFGDEDDK